MTVLALLWLLAAVVVRAQVAAEDNLAAGVAESAASNNGSTAQQYILLYPGYTSTQLQEKCQALNCIRIFQGVVQGIVVNIDPAAATTLSAEDPALQGLTPNVQVTVSQAAPAPEPQAAAEAPPGVAPPPGVQPYYVRPVPYWLNRISQASLPLNNMSYSPLNNCTGVRMYMLDSGVRSTHMEFRVAGNPLYTRILPGYTVSSIRSRNSSQSGSSSINFQDQSDCNGHGTHVASLAGGLYSGVCNGANLVPVRAIDCSGAADIVSIVEALDWIVEDAANYTDTPIVINMSVGTEQVNDVLQSAVNNTVSMFNLSIVAAAGNSGTDSCVNTPARSVYVVTVSASNITDGRPSYSNFGRCTSVYAPGDHILAAGFACDTCGAVLSGTSMATPIVSGISAMYMAENAMQGVKTTWGMVVDFINAAYYRNPATNIRIAQLPPLGKSIADRGDCSTFLNQIVPYCNANPGAGNVAPALGPTASNYQAKLNR